LTDQLSSQVGRQIGPYTTLSLLGVGGMGEERLSSVVCRRSAVPTDDSGLV